MLQDIRQNIQGTAAKIVVGLIVISFAFFGIESILLSGGGSGMAEVNGESIQASEVQQLVNTEKRRLISMMGDNIDYSLLDDQRMGAQALQSGKTTDRLKGPQTDPAPQRSSRMQEGHTLVPPGPRTSRGPLPSCSGNSAVGTAGPGGDGRGGLL